MSSASRGRNDDVTLAAKILVEGGLIAFPTETVYGLGADATNAAAVAKVYAAKSRPVDHPLIVHVGQRSDLERFGRPVNTMACALADAFWPGPLTIIVARGQDIAPETTGGRETVGLRMPDHPLALALLSTFAAIGSGAVAAPSANRFGGVSPTKAEHVVDDLGSAVDLVLDGGPSRVGVESTIIDVTDDNPVLLRPGGISTVEIEAVLGRSVTDGRRGVSRAPGMLASHYAPSATVTLVDRQEAAALQLEPGDGVVTIAENADGRSEAVVLGEGRAVRWRLPSDASGYAARLYTTMRKADEEAVRHLYVVPPSSGPLRDAVLDRLTKAAAPR